MPPIAAIEARLREAGDGITREFEEQQRRWRYQIRRGRVWFDDEAKRAHRRLRQSIPAYIRDGSIRSLISAPIIYSLILPLALLDLWVSTYQWICFPIYGIARVPRGPYFAVDRRKLAYLNGIEKVGCTFCSYASGLIAFVREVAARTEQYWCPIKHALKIQTPHARYKQFFDYGDAASYRGKLIEIRRALPQAADPAAPGDKTPATP